MTREILTLPEFIAEQEALEEEAAEVLPLKFDKCSYEEGYIRQSLYVCLDCPSKPAVICYGCSISCHTHHRLEELWLKRGLRCDCPTEKFSSIQFANYVDSCELRKEKAPNNNNVYEPKHNYEGRYCWCDSPFGVDQEQPKLATSLIENSPEQVANGLDDEDPNLMIQCYFCEDWFHAKCMENLMKLDLFDEFICKDCVSKHSYMLSFVDNKLICKNTEEIQTFQPDSVCKRRTVEEPACNLFLKSGWRSCLCPCEQCMEIYPKFVKVEESIYEPEIDENRNVSSHDAAVSLLENVERSQFMHGFDAFHKLKSNLKEYLTPFAQEGKVVTSEDVKDFFDQEKKKAKLS